MEKIEVFQDSIPAASKVVDSLVSIGDCSELRKILLQMLRSPTRIMEKQFHSLASVADITRLMKVLEKVNELLIKDMQKQRM